jgi:CysZ protein
MLIANAYLLGREYFTMVAMRHMPVRQATHMRKINSGRVWAAGLVPAGLALIPFLNILVPLFSTSYFVHIFKKIAMDQQAV